jgi:hypothetical protein
MKPYDELFEKDPDLIKCELDRTRAAIGITLSRGAAWIDSQLSPQGPVMRERDLSIVYKTAWLFTVTQQTEKLRRLLDWTAQNALTPDGDLSTDTGDGYGDLLYVQSYIARAAETIGHPLAASMRSRMREYQLPSGAVAAGLPYEQGTPVSVVDAAVHGLYSLTAGDEQSALRSGDWILRMIDANRAYMRDDGRFYFTGDVGAVPLVEFESSEAFERVIALDTAVQPGWVIGLMMAYLAALAKAADDSGRDASSYVAAACSLIDFEERMPVESYFNLNKCKLAWGAGELLRYFCLRGDLQDTGYLQKLYAIGVRVYSLTFLLSRLQSGAWSHDFYPLDSDSAEMGIDHRSFEGLSALPDGLWREAAETHVVVSAIEVTAENLAWLRHFEMGVDALARFVTSNMAVADEVGHE